jgi:hypothetical protein
LKLRVPLKKVKEALAVIQSLEPNGVGARNLKEWNNRGTVLLLIFGINDMIEKK